MRCDFQALNKRVFRCCPNRAGFKCVEALGRIIIRDPYGFLLLIK